MPVEVKKGSELETVFIDSLKGMVKRKDRAALAALRRVAGRSGGFEASAAAVFYSILPAAAEKWQERDYWLAANLFASNYDDTDSSKEKRTFAQSMRSLRDKLERQRGGAGSAIDRRFVALLSSPREDLDVHLRNMASRLRGEDIAIDYVQLIKDLRWWDASNQSVRRRWARDFWAAGSDKDNDNKE